MRINEIFYSLQGEGARAGCPSVFVRLSGCDLRCGFCDTEFESGATMTVEDVALEVDRVFTVNDGVKNESKWIIWTGGEPALQLTDEIVARFKAMGWSQAIETNGGHAVPSGLDWVVCSPKVAEHVLAKNFPMGVDELRYPRHAGQPGVPRPSIPSKRHFISPIIGNPEETKQNLRHCIKLCLANPKWSLSVQMHKLWRIQ